MERLFGEAEVVSHVEARSAKVKNLTSSAMDPSVQSVTEAASSSL